MVFILDNGVGFHMRIWAASTGSFFMDNTSTRLTMNWAETVAAAAPATPSPGIGVEGRYIPTQQTMFRIRALEAAREMVIQTLKGLDKSTVNTLVYGQ